MNGNSTADFARSDDTWSRSFVADLDAKGLGVAK
jgi:hypothetical protein